MNDRLDPFAVSTGDRRMALNDFEGELVLVGWFLYDGTVPTRIEIIARNYDVEYQLNEPADLLETREQPAPLGLDGRLYYFRGSLEPHPTLEAVQAWADRQPSSDLRQS